MPSRTSCGGVISEARPDSPDPRGSQGQGTPEAFQSDPRNGTLVLCRPMIAEARVGVDQPEGQFDAVAAW